RLQPEERQCIAIANDCPGIGINRLVYDGTIMAFRQNQSAESPRTAIDPLHAAGGGENELILVAIVAESPFHPGKLDSDKAVVGGAFVGVPDVPGHVAIGMEEHRISTLPAVDIKGQWC